MKLNTLNKRFWEVFKECPRKACFLFQKQQTFGMSVKRFKKKSVNEYKYELLEKIFIHILSNKELDNSEIKKHFLALINSSKFSIKNSTKYTAEEKSMIITTLDLMRDLQELEMILKLIDQRDIHIFTSLKINIKLKNYLKLKFSQDFNYELSIPLITELDNNEVKIIVFNHNGYPNFMYEYDSDINIIKTFIKKDTENKIREIIVYDFKNMERYSSNLDVIHLKEIKSILSIVDKNLLFFNSNEEKCKNCTNFSNCFNIMKKGIEWTL